MTWADAVIARVVRSGDCWVWTGAVDRHGYGQMRVEGRTTYVHRVVADEVLGPLEPGEAVCHRCDNPPCVRPDHLFIGSQADNLADMTAKGHRRNLPPQPGELHPRHRLTAEQVREIRRRRAAGEKLTDLGREFSVTKAHIGNIAARRLWKSLPD